jgi:chemotaxis protein methyltransferase CheR
MTQLTLNSSSVSSTEFPGMGEFTYTQTDFEMIASLIYTHAGIVMTREKAMLIFSRYTKLLRARDMRVFADYVELIRTDSTERRVAIEALTTNHTRFFREDHHFTHFERQVRPHLIEKLQAKQRVRMWSAGSSSGEEVYSLTMTMLGRDRQFLHQIASGDMATLATDLAQHVLDTAIRGEYPASAAEDIPPALSELWTRCYGSKLEIVPQVRELIRFRRLNLLDAWPIKNRFDVIFCRNVMIYFDEAEQKRLIEKFYRCLNSEGYLFVGHAESLFGLTDKFKMIHKDNGTAYQRLEISTDRI